MKKHIIFAMSAVLALSFTSCKDEETVEVGQWNSSSDYAVVYFPESTKTIELDPAAETTYTLSLSRRNPQLSDMLDAEHDRIADLIQDQEDNMAKEIAAEQAKMKAELEAEGLTDDEKAAITDKYEKAIKAIQDKYQAQIDILQGQYDEFESVQCDSQLEALEVPITITSGDSDILTISSAKFEKGKWDGEYTISFPKAEVGTTYEVQYAVTDPQYVSYYSDAATATFSVTRVKWVSVGKATLSDAGIFGGSATIDVLMKDGDNTKFRFMHPYDAILTGDEDYNPAIASEYTEITLLKTGQTLEGVKITEPDLVYFTPIHSGYVHPTYGKEIIIWHPADLYASPSEDLFLASHVLGYQNKNIEGKEYKIPGAINLAPYYYMSGVGGWNYTTGDPCIRIIFDGFKLKYEANIFTDGDFEWEEMYTGEFTSSQLGTVENATLYKGKCVATQDDADKVFTANYGTPYILEAPYAEGYDIIFFVKDGRIQMPKAYDEDLGLQPIGIEAAGLPVYVTINGSSSSFSDNIVKLNLTFQAERKYRDANGRTQYEYITLDTKDEILANITWSEFATGNFTYDFFSPNEDGSLFTDPDPYVLLKRDDVDNMYKIHDWGMGTDFLFTWDQTTNKCSVSNQDIKYAHPTYGAVFMVEGKEYNETKYGEYTSYYDPETKTFHFFPVYYVEAGAFGQVEETFELTGDGAGVKHKATRFVRNNLVPLKVNTTLAPFFNVKKLAKPTNSKDSKKKFSSELF